MKPLPLHDRCDLALLSAALHQALLALRLSPLQLTTRHLCRLLRLHHSELARMRWVHKRPAYRRLVNKLLLWRVLHYLLEHFPTLLIAQSARGEVTAHLYKYRAGKRLRRSLRRLRPPEKPLRRGTKPGSTRWYLESQAIDPPARKMIA